jgi:hypothetical protein
MPLSHTSCCFTAQNWTCHFKKCCHMLIIQNMSRPTHRGKVTMLTSFTHATSGNNVRQYKQNGLPQASAVKSMWHSYWDRYVQNLLPVYHTSKYGTIYSKQLPSYRVMGSFYFIFGRAGPRISRPMYWLLHFKYTQLSGCSTWPSMGKVTASYFLVISQKDYDYYQLLP